MGVEGTSVGWAAEVYSRWGTGVDVRLLVPRPEEGGYGVGINSGSVGAWYGINEAINGPKARYSDTGKYRGEQPGAENRTAFRMSELCVLV